MHPPIAITDWEKQEGEEEVQLLKETAFERYRDYMTPVDILSTLCEDVEFSGLRFSILFYYSGNFMCLNFFPPDPYMAAVWPFPAIRYS